MRLRTGCWYGDRERAIEFPAEWEVSTHWPATPPPLADEALEAAIRAAPIRERARGCRRPVVIVDDPTRPTPVARVLPFVLEELGVDPAAVTLLVATGMHGAPAAAALAGKVGETGCRVVVHDPLRGLVRLGRTTLGSPALVNGEIARADFVMGISGIYPQNTAGYGGGSKLIIGVLGKRSIVQLHYGRRSADGYDIENEFRRDLDDMARMAGLQTMVSLQVDADRAIVRIACGAPGDYHAAEVRFARDTFAAPPPGDADVVIANAYPMDTSLTMARFKGVIPLRHARPAASRLLIAASPEGLGRHALFPFARPSALQPLREKWRRLSVRPKRELAARALRRLLRPRGNGRTETPAAGRPILLLHDAPSMPDALPGLEIVADWADALHRIRREQGDRPLRVVVYPCAPLQCVAGARSSA